MKSRPKFAVVLIFLAAAVALCATNPGALALLGAAEGSSEHYVVTNDGDGYNGMLDTGTVLKLEGTTRSPRLKALATLKTGVTGNGGGIAVLRSGSDICAFLENADFDADSISAFKYPGMKLVGNFADPQWSQSGDLMAIAGHSNYLFTSFIANVPPYLSYIDVWTVGKGCQLSLQGTYPAAAQNSPVVFSMAVTPNGKTLLAVYTYYGEVDSFSIGAGGALTERGPYQTDAAAAEAVDVTADSRYALFAVIGYYPNTYTQIIVYAVNSDGGLGAGYSFGGGGQLGPGEGASQLWLSPDERFLFVSDLTTNRPAQLTTLSFTETPLNLTYSGCIANPRSIPEYNYTGWLATVSPSGSGDGLYVAETTPAVGLFEINSRTGCLKEVPGSPFPTGEQQNLLSLIAWPPRPF